MTIIWRNFHASYLEKEENRLKVCLPLGNYNKIRP